MADDIVFRIRAEGTEKFIAELKKSGVVVEQTGDKVEKENKKMGNSFSALGKTIGAAFSVAAIIQFTKVLARTAIDIDATGQKVKTVFGESAKDIDRFARATANSLGLTVNQYKRAAAAIGDLLIPIGFQRKEAAKLSADLVNLSGALSAWTGGQKSATEVSEILTKALLGEREQLKTLGVQISEADVSTRLLEKGQKNLTGAALAQAKATATLELIYEKTTDAQAASNDDTITLAEAQQKLTANVLELRDSLAEGLIPALASTFETINNGLDGLEKFGVGLNTLLQSNPALIGANAAFNKSQAEVNDAIAEAIALTDEQLISEQGRLLVLKATEEINQRELILLTAINEEIARRDQLIGGGGATEEEVRSLRFLNDELKKQQKIINESKPYSEEFFAAAREARKLEEEIKKIKEALKIEETEFVFFDALGGLPNFINALAGDIDSNLTPVVKDLVSELKNAGLAIPENFDQIATDAAKDNTDARIAFAQMERDEKIAAVQQYAAVAQEITGNLSNIIAQNQQIELDALQSKFEQGLISEETFNRERAELLKKSAIANKANAVFDVGLNTARAITNALAAPLPPPGPQILAALVAGLAAAQLATVLRQPIPQFAEGTKGRKRAPSGFAWVGEEGPELMQMRGGEKIITHQDSEELVRLMAGYGIPVQFNTLEKELYKPMTKMEALISNKQAPIDLNPLVRSNDMNRLSLGKKLDRIHEAIVSTNTRKMTKA